MTTQLSCFFHVLKSADVTKGNFVPEFDALFSGEYNILDRVTFVSSSSLLTLRENQDWH